MASTDGLLIVDKPAGPTSHDVVARVRRVLGTRRVGHTGTLDPMATGVLPIVVGRATRLARFLAGADKAYAAEIRLGYATDTGDATGRPVFSVSGDEPAAPIPDRDTIARVLSTFLGEQDQVPPAFSAKKIGGIRAHALARRGEPAVPPAATVTLSALDLIALEGDVLRVALVCSAGFYVRALARDLGVRLGTGAHLARLRRVRSGRFTEQDAVPLDTLESEAATVPLRPLDGLLDELPALVLGPDGVRRATHGQDIGPGDAETGAFGRLAPAPHVRLLDPQGRLVAVAEAGEGPGLLHPVVVLM